MYCVSKETTSGGSICKPKSGIAKIQVKTRKEKPLRQIIVQTGSPWVFSRAKRMVVIDHTKPASRVVVVMIFEKLTGI